jgi:hypothetical protein
MRRCGPLPIIGCMALLAWFTVAGAVVSLRWLALALADLARSIGL